MKLKRHISRGDKGPDVLAVKRALKDAGYGKYIFLSRTFGTGLDRQLRKYQRDHKLPVDGVFGQKTLAQLLPHFDLYGRQLLRSAPEETPQDLAFKKLIMWCEHVDSKEPPYVWGGQHGVPLSQANPGAGFDCSSSCSFVLYKAGLFPNDYSWVSGTFATHYGFPGSGKFYTVYANWEHVFIRFHKGKYWRFDTSPHGDGGRGPRLRRLPRFTRGFSARHLSKM